VAGDIVADPEKSLVRSLQRGLHILNVVATKGPLRVKPIARSIGVSIPTAYHLVRTLVHAGYLSRLDDGTYVLGEQLSNREITAPCPKKRQLAITRTGR
jgi:Mn-dependent DtxR family transcriptional regulator